MNSVQIADMTFVVADPAAVGRVFGEAANWSRWFPDLQLRVTADRAEQGVRWAVSGALTGTMEVWLQPVLDGVIVHYFLHAEPAGLAGWQLAKLDVPRLVHRRRAAARRMTFEVKADLERDRPIGLSRFA